MRFICLVPFLRNNPFKESERERESKRKKKRKRERERENHVVFVKGFLLYPAPGSALEKFAHGPGPWTVEKIFFDKGIPSGK